MMPYQYLELIDDQTDYAVHSADFYKPVYCERNRMETNLNVVVRPRFTMSIWECLKFSRMLGS
jgi:hypothetical protein